ncbi:MAG: metallophosphoesterase [Planctomycetota bacterium]
MVMPRLATPSPSRREFLAASAALLATPALAAGDDSVSIGLFADSHYADRQPRGSRHYRDSAAKLAAFVRAMNEAKPDFAIVVGDYTDERGGAPEKVADLKHIEAVFRQFNGPRHHVIGNHDLDVFTKEQFLAGTGMPAPHYAFDCGPLRCIVLDANYRKDGTPYAAGNFNWTQTYIPPAEQRWLAAELAGTKRKAVVFVHQCLDDEGGAHGVKNAPEVRRVLEASGKVIAVFQGHNHRGAYRAIRGIHYLTLRAMVEGAGLANNAFSLATVSLSGALRLRGYGKQPSRKPKGDG